MNIERIQTGVRLEKRLVKVLKALAEYRDVSLGDLLEGIVLHAFEARSPFSRETLEVIARLTHVYGLKLTATDSHRLVEVKGDAKRMRKQAAGGAAPAVGPRRPGRGRSSEAKRS